ncbi:MAG: type II toxin-antitoxin system prevent-host-death family antitoxin [Acidobacteria bacterium]|nr:MAG: type II toxin-antitoxin system prevent-host-death family antitoxin [Acidobacteriota bacterium]
MVSLGVRALKGRLSHYLRRVEGGVHLTITDRGRPIATISPAAPAPVPAWLREMIAKGQATWSGGKPAGLARRIPTKGKPASQQILEDRR